jgi:hypothetical protein
MGCSSGPVGKSVGFFSMCFAVIRQALWLVGLQK